MQRAQAREAALGSGKKPSKLTLFPMDLYLFETAAYAYGENYLDLSDAREYATFAVRLSRY